jgi:hypothetical protein
MIQPEEKPAKEIRTKPEKAQPPFSYKNWTLKSKKGRHSKKLSRLGGTRRAILGPAPEGGSERCFGGEEFRGMRRTYMYVGMTRDEAQHSRWIFCEVVITGRGIDESRRWFFPVLLPGVFGETRLTMPRLRKYPADAGPDHRLEEVQTEWEKRIGSCF